ncbi:MAG: phospho-N-acetylmuramoyl-pentapeptide-transferase [Eubacterium sp.]|nr:phospho-N-acetylmuramoyl-pentapeptide-transferase [Eubacterium sp.]MBR3275783.1 phospho-N-acetylmuramoyl-pentapeptide-transferase [Eubacterium sp.]
MIKAILVPLFAAFAVTAVLGPILIPALKRLKFGQTEREEGVQSHLKKAGTPTMGGIMFLIAIFLVSVIAAFKYPQIVPVLILTGGFAITGFIDDYLKVVKKNSTGLKAWQKLLLEILFTTVFLVYLLKCTDISLLLRIPFSGGRMLNLGWFAIPFLYIVVLAVVNGVNFTDGLDGLASSVTSVVAAAFMAAAFLTGAGVEPVAAAVIGGLLGFLLYNTFPAKVFMGDTGSLALGGFVAGMAYVMNMPLFIPIIGLIYAIELLSVVIQVTYFKATHGKRIFKMTPIHHHFELCGWSEPRIVAVFTIITVLLSIVGLAAL